VLRRGKNPNEAYNNLEKVAESWIEAAIDQGQEIPEPFAIRDFSGRIALRIPKSIHKQSVKFAEMDGTSLNQFFLTAVAARVGAEEFYERLYNKLETKCMAFVTAIPSYTTVNLNAPLWTIGSVNMMAPQNFPYELSGKSFTSFESGGLEVVVPSGQILIEKEAGNG